MALFLGGNVSTVVRYPHTFRRKGDMTDLDYLQYRISNFFMGIPPELTVIVLIVAAVIAYKCRTALAVGGAVLMFLLASGYLVLVA